MRKVTQQNLREVFSYQEPSDGQVGRMQQIRAAAAEFADAILEHAPTCPDQTAAIRKVREAVMMANAAIVLENVD